MEGQFRGPDYKKQNTTSSNPEVTGRSVQSGAPVTETKKPEAKKEPTLGELDEVIRNAQERLHKKKLEFDFVTNLDKKEVSKYILNADNDTLANAMKKADPKREEKIIVASLKKQQFLQEKIKQHEEIQSQDPNQTPTWMTLRILIRKFQHFRQLIEFLPLWIRICRNKWKKREIISMNQLAKRGRKIKRQLNDRINELHDILKRGKAKHSIVDSNQEYEKVTSVKKLILQISDKYYQKYSRLMTDQLRQEVERRRRNKFMNDIHEMRSTLHRSSINIILKFLEKVDLEHPKIWNRKPLDPRQAQNINELYKRKLAEISDPSLKYHIDYETDILKKVDAYFIREYDHINLDREGEMIKTEKYKDEILGDDKKKEKEKNKDEKTDEKKDEKDEKKVGKKEETKPSTFNRMPSKTKTHL